MRRWMIMMMALLLTMGAALPAWANDSEDCNNVRMLMKTDPQRAVAACRRLADLGKAFAQYNLGLMYDNGNGVSRNYAERSSGIARLLTKVTHNLKTISGACTMMAMASSRTMLRR